ncbi:MAG: radical SAM protein [Lachnospiraceae bacterium]|nr:radical SAM protein [Lachnospiraceae bacterium]
MYKIKSGTRMIQTRSDIKNNQYKIYNNSTGNELELNSIAAALLRKYYKKDAIDKMSTSILAGTLFKELVNAGIIIDSTTASNNVFLSKRCEYSLPLTALSLELTDACNLNCIHCYGSFGCPKQSKTIPFQWIKDNIPVFNDLNVRKIALTGGESTLHPDFLQIAELLLKEGFEVCIFSNGYNTEVLQKLLSKTREYKYMIKISLDGNEETHGIIRNNSNSYKRAIEAIREVSKYSNISLYISTVVMKNNIDKIDELSSYIAQEFPGAIHTKDLIFPMGNASNLSFNVADFDYINKKVPSVFVNKEAPVTNGKTHFRCSGGISQATLTPGGYLKICNAAADERFYFKHNVFEKGLKKAWIECGDNIQYYRNEKACSTIDCKQCSSKEVCTMTDCRVLAYSYLNNCRRSNPVTCYAVKTHRKDNK